MDIQIAAKTDVGLVRKNNEDSFVVCADLSAPDWTCHETSEPIRLGKYGSLLVVADGMGGANAGEVASAIAVETVKALFLPETLVSSGFRRFQEGRNKTRKTTTPL